MDNDWMDEFPEYPEINLNQHKLERIELPSDVLMSDNPENWEEEWVEAELEEMQELDF